ncbi:Hypothetical protein NTJ_02125 [Nesidiocoris tenuis]|uniref:Uncharacterized protein n=1 Tax=Nesidiocoris tenuis TaxID=355587 RepID=A0ABN7ABC3_9HEMI|nr:Hypothetical protein NTJ_02125 [Nesidiocoris tenuis]
MENQNIQVAEGRAPDDSKLSPRPTTGPRFQPSYQPGNLCWEASRPNAYRDEQTAHLHISYSSSSANQLSAQEVGLGPEKGQPQLGVVPFRGR